jgi:hypothetical protein
LWTALQRKSKTIQCLLWILIYHFSVNFLFYCHKSKQIYTRPFPTSVIHFQYGRSSNNNNNNCSYNHFALKRDRLCLTRLHAHITETDKKIMVVSGRVIPYTILLLPVPRINALPIVCRMVSDVAAVYGSHNIILCIRNVNTV